MLAPGFLSRKVQGIEKQKQQTIKQLIIEMHAAGIENPSKFFFRSNQQPNGKGTDKRKNKIGRGDGDEDYEPFNGEEGLSDDDDENDDSSRSKAKKVKRAATGKKNGGSTTQEEGSSPHEATQALQLPTPPTEDTDPFASPHTVIGNVVHEARTTMSKKPTRKRGPTKLKTIAIDGGSRIKVLFNEMGIPIGEGSVKLSSFSGALVREIVPYTLSDWRKLPSSTAEVLWKSIQVRFELDEEWQRQIVFQKMNESWRAAKSILVTKVIAASNEEERLKLQPPNIKSLHNWKDFVKEKMSANFKAKSNNFKEIRKKQLELQHTTSRKGYARLTAEMKEKKKPTSRVAVWAEGHKRKIGHPANKKVEDKTAEMEKIERETPKSSSSNLKEDALCKVLGPEKNGRLRTFGKGVTLTKLSVLSQMSGHIAQLHEENVQFKSQMAHMQDTIDELKKNQAQNAATTEGTPTTPIVSPSRVTSNPGSDNCKLLDWMGTGEEVAEGHWSSSDPNELVHHIPLGPNAMRVWVDVPKKPEAFLWRPTSYMETIEEAVGTTVAWPADKVLMDSTPRSEYMRSFFVAASKDRMLQMAASEAAIIFLRGVAHTT